MPAKAGIHAFQTAPWTALVKPPPQINKSFLVLFFKKELSYFAFS